MRSDRAYYRDGLVTVVSTVCPPKQAMRSDGSDDDLRRLLSDRFLCPPKRAMRSDGEHRTYRGDGLFLCPPKRAMRSDLRTPIWC